MISLTRSHSSGSCGCGGHASTSSGCGGGCGTADCRDGAIVRPLFFAGQLLTEEDLQALSGYVSAKSRLHNRSFFGEGVACGFEVVCHPCGGGKVIVRPGHALDCCGNDIVLSAAQTLDVNALVRELRKKLQGGIDCGDPCAEPNQDNNQRQRYCLYVHYCESQTDPVSAFVTDEPCGTAACEPTRVREGLRFELRCREKAKPSGGFLCQVSSCLGGPELLTDLTALDRIVRQSEEALALSQQDQAYDPTRMSESALKLTRLVGAADQERTGPSFRKAVAQTAVVTVHLNRFRPEPPAPGTDPQVPAEIKLAEDALDQVAEKIVPNIQIGAPTDLEKSFARRVVENAGEALNNATQTTKPVKLWRNGDPNVKKLNGQLDQKLCSLRERLLDRLDASPDLALCALRNEARALPIPCPPQSPPLPFADRIDLARKLLAVWRRLWQDCACHALLPPCPPCDDLGVLLACLEVETCEVVEVCNLERRLVPTAVALRHWLPLDGLGRIAEELRCMEPRNPPQPGWNLGSILKRLCPSARDQADLVQVILWRLGWDSFDGPPRLEPVPVLATKTVPQPVPAIDQEEMIRTVAEGLNLATVGRIETLEKAMSDLKDLRSENEDLLRRLKALEAKNAKASEGRKKP